LEALNDEVGVNDSIQSGSACLKILQSRIKRVELLLCCQIAVDKSNSGFRITVTELSKRKNLLWDICGSPKDTWAGDDSCKIAVGAMHCSLDLNTK
jgi:hypothetical protein